MSKFSTETQHDPYEVTDYIINVKTSNRFGAGTDANIYVQLCGTKQYSDPILLKNSQNVNKFERNQLDQFTFRDYPSAGEIKAVKVWHDNSGLGAAWHLEFLEISDISSGLKYRFPCHRWFSTTEDDGKICREIRCTEVTDGPKCAVQVAVGVPKKAQLTHCIPITPPDEKPANLIIPKQAVLVCSARRNSNENGSHSPSKSVYGPYANVNNSQSFARPKTSFGSLYGPYSNR